MIVYCDARECLNNINGICNNHYPTGVEAIALRGLLFGGFECGSYESDEDEVSEESK